MDFQKLKIRQQIIDLARQFFAANNFQEVTLPVLSRSIPTEPNIYPFTTLWQYSQDKLLYLSTSPEAGLKRLMAQGLGNCFALGHSFRDLEAKGPYHQPEFLMLEWYRLAADYTRIMADTQELIKHISQRLNKDSDNRTNNLLTSPFTQIPFIELFQKYVPDFDKLPDNEPDLNQLFLNYVEPQLKKMGAVFVTDYPAFISPLAAIHPDRPLLSQRFELYINGLEIANGCTENLDPQIPVTWDKQLPSAGCGLGIDRLAMVLTGSDSIDQVLPLPL